MFFPFRAAFVIGAIFYLSPVRPSAPWETDGRPVSDVLSALPEGLRDQAIRVGAETLTKGSIDGHAALLRTGLDREAAPEALLPSRDTLREADRTTPWRGAGHKTQR